MIINRRKLNIKISNKGIIIFYLINIIENI